MKRKSFKLFLLHSFSSPCACDHSCRTLQSGAADSAISQNDVSRFILLLTALFRLKTQVYSTEYSTETNSIEKTNHFNCFCYLLHRFYKKKIFQLSKWFYLFISFIKNIKKYIIYSSNLLDTGGQQWLVDEQLQLCALGYQRFTLWYHFGSTVK